MKRDNEVFSSILTGLTQALDYEQGQLSGVKRRKITITPLPRYQADKIRSIRNTLNLSQMIFAEAIGVSKKTVEAWESGRNKPQGPALRMLQVLETDNSFLENHNIVCI